MALPPDAGPGDLVGDQAPPTIEIEHDRLSVDGSPVGIESRELEPVRPHHIVDLDHPARCLGGSDDDSVTVEFNPESTSSPTPDPAVVRLGTRAGLGDEQPPPIPS